jgi:hypothetical protein
MQAAPPVYNPSSRAADARVDCGTHLHAAHRLQQNRVWEAPNSQHNLHINRYHDIVPKYGVMFGIITCKCHMKQLTTMVLLHDLEHVIHPMPT